MNLYYKKYQKYKLKYLILKKEIDSNNMVGGSCKGIKDWKVHRKYLKIFSQELIDRKKAFEKIPESLKKKAIKCGTLLYTKRRVPGSCTHFRKKYKTKAEIIKAINKSKKCGNKNI